MTFLVDESLSRRHRRFWNGQFQECTNSHHGGSRFLDDDDDLVSVTLMEEDSTESNDPHSSERSDNSDSRGGSNKLWRNPFSRSTTARSQQHHPDDPVHIPTTIFTTTSKSSQKHLDRVPSNQTTTQWNGMFIRQNVKL